WSEKSPALVAIGINLVITAVMGISWILFWQDNTIKLPAILTLILSFNLILIYAAIAQFILLIKVKKPAIWAIGILGGLIFIQPLVLIIFITHPVQSPNLWLLSTFPWLSIGQDSLAIAPMLIAIISQWSILTLLTFLLTRKIQKLGASDSQKLLTGQKN
ncbi:MAG: ABC transporter permease, partial [Okeania sp. SIO3C4]|nr:ABC transporter permease [Okeania sp. SIO3C4]